MSTSNDSSLTICLNDNIIELSDEQQQILVLLLKHRFSTETLNRPLAKVSLMTILDVDIYLKINAYH